MITFEDAQRLAASTVDQLEKRIGMPLMIDEAATRDEGWCWVFFYNSRAYLESDNSSEALAGNGPIVVERAAAIHLLTAARSVDVQLAELDASN